MTQHDENGTTERLAAHERLATGGARALDARLRRRIRGASSSPGSGSSRR